MFTRNAIFLFIYLQQNQLEAAIPIQIVTEKTDAERISQEFPHILTMIPDKESLITQAVSRKQSTDEKNPVNSQENPLGELITVLHQNTTKAKQKSDKKTYLSDTKTLTKEQKNPASREEKSYGQISEVVTEKPKISDINWHSTVVLEEPKKADTNTSRHDEISRKEQLFLEKTLTESPSQRQKRSLQGSEQIVPDQTNSLEGEEISKEDLRRYNGQWNKQWNGHWNEKYGFYHYDSGYVDYNVPFPYYKRPRSKPVSVPHGTEIAAAQLFPILKSLLIGSSSLTGRRHNYKGRPFWKQPW